jgi:hypothetical protein
MSVLEDLQKAAMEKNERLNSVIASRSKMERELMDEVRAKVKGAWGDEERKANEDYAGAMKVLKEERERLAMVEAEAKVPCPVGTRMVAWRKDRYAGVWREDEARGVLEIFKDGDEYPSNQRWDRPNTGDIVVRLLTKDGKPGKKAEKLVNWKRGMWLPKGQMPKDNQ